ncbi:MAG: response regulator [Thermoanaerobaculia bacterium]
MAKKILLADDSITIQKVVELTFSDGDYEVIATSNGAKAIQKLSEIRPDIILSDIIMPEKNGYEVCEFVKSHPELRSIPVILLTGTFEPFDPDRAEKAGCDAVVTKPFESQNLVHKVEELIQQSQAGLAPEEPTATEEPFGESPADDALGSIADDTSAWPLPKDVLTPPPPPLEALESELPPPPPIPEAGSVFDDSSARLRSLFGDEAPPTPAEFQTHGDDIFAAAQSEDAPSEMPFEEPPQPPEVAQPEEEPQQAGSEMPFGEIEAPPYSGETRAFPKMTLDELQAISAPPPPEPAFEQPEAEPSRHLSLDEEAAVEPPPMEPPPVETPSSEEPPQYAGETRAFPRFSFDDLGSLQSPTPAAPTIEQPPLGDFAGIVHEPEAPIGPPELEQNAFETREPEPEPEFGDISEPAPHEPEAAQPFAEETAPPEIAEPPALPGEKEPWAAAPEAPPASEWVEPAPEGLAPPPAFEPAGFEEAPQSIASTEAAFAAAEGIAQPEVAAPIVGRLEPAAGPFNGALTDEQVDRIARRVVELMSDKAIRDIAWEVIPDLAEVIVKDRIRQLENEE